MPSEPVPTNILLDTNIFVADFPLAGVSFGLLRDGIRRTDATLLVPRVVYDETLNRFRECVETLLADANSLSIKASRILGRDFVVPTDPLELAVEHYRAFLDAELKGLSAILTPYPEVSHEEVVAWALSRKKPFRPKGSGYRDYLLWVSIREQAKRRTAAINFATRNMKDFASGTELHMDLLDDLVARKVPTNSIRIFPGLKSLTEELLVPKLERLNEIYDLLVADRFQQFSFRPWVQTNFSQALEQHGWDRHMAPLWDFGGASVRFRGISQIHSATVDDVRLMTNGDTLLSASTDITTITRITAFPWQFIDELPSVRRALEAAVARGERLSIDYQARAVFRVSLILEQSTYRVLQMEVDSWEDEEGGMSFKEHPRRHPTSR